MSWLRRHEAPVAAAIILVVVIAGWLVMPRIMLRVSAGGPVAGVLVAIAFILSFFGVLWLRSLWQRGAEKD
jgi:hypothetical protein